MRTTITIDIDDELMRELRAYAAQSGRTIDEVIEAAVRESIGRQRSSVKAPGTFRLPTIDGGGLRPGVNLDDASALLDLMDERTD